MSAPFTLPDSAEAIGADLDALIAEAGQKLHLKRALLSAFEYGFTLLDALDIDSLALDRMDAAIVGLDVLDGDTDFEDGADDEFTGDDEDSLGWREAVTQNDLGLGQDDGEPTLGAPERSPYVAPMGAGFYKPARGGRLTRCFNNRAWNQAQWAAGGLDDREDPTEDLEAEPGYDLPEGDDERCGSEHDGAEPDESDQNLGAPAGDGDQRHWAQGDARDYEQAVDGDGELPADWYKRPIGPFLPLERLDWLEQRAARRDLTRHVEAIRGRHRTAATSFDPDAVMPIRPGMVSWGGPSPRGICNVSPVAMPVRVVGP